MIEGKGVPSASLSNHTKAVGIATILREWILSEKSHLTESVASIPGVESGITFKSLKERLVEDWGDALTIEVTLNPAAPPSTEQVRSDDCIQKTFEMRDLLGRASRSCQS